MNDRYRLFASIAALIGWLTLALQLSLTIQLTMANGGGALAGLWRWLDYFTITTNLLATAALTAAAIYPRGVIVNFFGRPGVHTMTAASITIVALVYNLVLRQLWHPHGLGLLTDESLHVVMPALFLMHWWLAVPKRTLRVAHLGSWLLYPAGYLVYALARGAFDGHYPYPFLDVGRLGYAGVAISGAAIGGAFLLIALVLLALARWQLRRQRNAMSTSH
jgi:hypothetical protein